MMGITLHVFWLTDEQYKLQEAGIDFEFDRSSLMLHTFYSISYVRPYKADKQFCYVKSDGSEFLVNESYESVNKKITNTKYNFLNN